MKDFEAGTWADNKAQSVISRGGKMKNKNSALTALKGANVENWPLEQKGDVHYLGREHSCVQAESHGEKAGRMMEDNTERCIGNMVGMQGLPFTGCRRKGKRIPTQGNIYWIRHTFRVVYSKKGPGCSG